MKKSKQFLALPILLMSCALSLSACFGGGELDPNGGNVDNGTTTEGMTEAEMLEAERQDVLASINAAIDEKRYDDAVMTADEAMQNSFAGDEEIQGLRDQAAMLSAEVSEAEARAAARAAIVENIKASITNGMYKEAVDAADAALANEAYAGDAEITALRDSANESYMANEAMLRAEAAHRELMALLNSAIDEMRYDDAINAANDALNGDYADDEAVLYARNRAESLKQAALDEEAKRTAEENERREIARDQLLETLNGLMSEGDFNAAIETSTNALKGDFPNDEELMSIRAEAIERRVAAQEAERAMALNNERNYYINRANREIGQGLLADAISTLDYGLEQFPGDESMVKLINKVKATIASRSSGATDDLERDLINTIEEYRREADKIYEQARGKYDDGEFSESKKAYLYLLELIQVSPYRAELRDLYEAKAKAGLTAAGVAEERERTKNDEARAIQAARLFELQAKADQKRRSDQIIELWRQVLFNMEVKRFNDAEDLVRTILDIDPNFKVARDLQSQIQELRLQNIRRDTYERKMQGWRNAILEVREAMQPNTQIVTYPQGALVRRIVERRNYLPDFAALDPGEVRLRNALEATIMSLVSDPNDNLNKKTLKQAVLDLAKEASVSILFSKNDETVTLGETVIEINVQNLSARRILSILKDEFEFEEAFSEGVLYIRAAGSAEDNEAEAARRRREVVTLVHDIRDITYQLQDFAGPVLNLRGQDDSFEFETPELPEPVDIDTIQEFIQAGVRGDEFWEAPNVISSFGGQLIVTSAPGIQAEIREFLKKMRRTAGLLVAMEARFIEVEDNYLTDFGIDFRGLGGPSNVPNQANLVLEDVTGQPEDAAGGAFDNGALGVPALNPSAGIFFNDDDPSGQVNFNRDIRGRFENIFDNALGNQLSNIGGMAMQVAIFHNLTQINMVIRAVQKKGRAQTLVAPRLSAYNTQRANIAIINQIPYIEDFQPQTAAAAGIANPIMDTILDGIVMEVVPTVSNDRRFITLEVQPTIAELVFPIPTFVTTLGPTSAVTIQIPELKLQTAKTTVRIPDGGAIVIGGLKTAREVDRESGTPILSDLPLIGVLFRRKGRSSERTNLVIVIKANIIDLSDEELRQPGYN